MKDDKQFLEALNQNLNIAYRICNIYFSDSDDRQDAFQEMMFNLYKGYPNF